MPALNVKLGPALPGSPQELLSRGGLWADRWLAVRDDLSLGPLRAGVPFASLMAERMEWRHRSHFATGRRGSTARQAAAELEAWRAAVEDAEGVRLWAGRTVQDQCFLVVFAAFLAELGHPAGEVALVQYGSGTLASLDQVPLALLDPPPEPVALPEEVAAAWPALTAPDPRDLAGFAAGGDGPLHAALGALLRRFPDEATGLGSVERAVVANTGADWVPAAAMVRGALADAMEGLDHLGDGILLETAVGLTAPHAPEPPLARRGPLRAMRTLELARTAFGTACLAGGASHALVNGVEAWIGGVHMTPADDHVWMRAADGDLVRRARLRSSPRSSP